MSSPTPPPPGQQPYGQQPPYAGQQQYGAPAPQPRKSRTGLVLGVLALVLVLVGAGIAIALVSGDDGDDDTKDTASEASLSEDTLGGEGYAFSLPKGWNDATEEAKQQDAPGTIDTVAVWGEKLDGSRANVIVEASSGVGDADLESLRSTWESNMSGAAGSAPRDHEGTTIDGEEAIGAKFERDNDSGTAIVQIAYLTVHEDTAYSITLSAKQDDADEATAAYEALLGGWTWES